MYGDAVTAALELSAHRLARNRGLVGLILDFAGRPAFRQRSRSLRSLADLYRGVHFST